MKIHTFIACILFATHSIYYQEVMPASFSVAIGASRVNYSVVQMVHSVHTVSTGTVIDGIYAGGVNNTIPKSGIVFIIEVADGPSVKKLSCLIGDIKPEYAFIYASYNVGEADRGFIAVECVR